MRASSKVAHCLFEIDSDKALVRKCGPQSTVVEAAAAPMSGGSLQRWVDKDFVRVSRRPEGKDIVMGEPRDYAAIVGRYEDMPLILDATKQQSFRFMDIRYLAANSPVELWKVTREAELLARPAMDSEGGLVIVCISPNRAAEGSLKILRLSRLGEDEAEISLHKVSEAGFDSVVYDSQVLSPDGRYLGVNFSRSQDVFKKSPLPQITFFFDLQAARFWSDRGHWDGYSLDNQGPLRAPGRKALELKSELETHGISLD